MKNVKKLLALLLALVMLFAVCACDNDKDGDKDEKTTASSKKQEKKDKLTDATLQGEWEAVMDMSAIMSGGVMGDMPEIFEMMDLEELNLQSSLNVTFEDGEMTIDADSMVNFYDDMIGGMMTWIRKGDNVYELMAMSSGEEMTAEECKEYFDEQGITKQQLLAAMESEMPSAEEAIGGELADVTNCYELNGNKLYTWKEGEEKNEDSYMQLTYEDDVITVTKVVTDGESVRLDDGDFVMEKK